MALQWKASGIGTQGDREGIRVLPILTCRANID